MITFFRIGAVELFSAVLGICAAAILLFIFKRPCAWRWLAVITSAFIFATAVTPADPLSMWLVAAATCGVFAAGVFLSPYLQGSRANSAI